MSAVELLHGDRAGTIVVTVHSSQVAQLGRDDVSSYPVTMTEFLLGTTGIGSAYGRLYEGDETGWSLGFQMTQTVGRRFQHARIRNLQLQLAKSTGLLNEQSADLEKELAIALREVDRTRNEIRLTQKIDESSSRNREANEARFMSEGDALSLLTWLRAEQRSLQSRIAAVNSTASYAQALSDLHFRTGTLLRLNCMSVSASGGEVIWEVKSPNTDNQIKNELAPVIAVAPMTADATTF